MNSFNILLIVILGALVGFIVTGNLGITIGYIAGATVFYAFQRMHGDEQ
jgi:hypothetical protein